MKVFCLLGGQDEQLYAAVLWIMFFVTFFIGFFETISRVSWSLILAKFPCYWSIMTIKALCQKL